MEFVSIFLIAIPLALAPGIGLSLFIYFRDKYEKEPFRLLRNCFLFGMLSIIPAILIELAFGVMGIDENQGILTTFVFAFLVVGGSEELSKFFVLRFYAYPKKDFNEPFDSIVYAMMISMGFATLENITTLFKLHINSPRPPTLVQRNWLRSCSVLVKVLFLKFHKFNINLLSAFQKLIYYC